jgi:hypothetical protein
MKPSRLRHDPTAATSTLTSIEPDDDPSHSGMRPRISLGDIQRSTGERVTVVFHGTFPIEGLVHFIRRHAQDRIGARPISARIEHREGDWEVALRFEGVQVVGCASDAFVAAMRAFSLLQ